MDVSKSWSFQQDFNVAIASWIECGIRQKMEKDITTSKAFRGHFEFWVPLHLPTNETLTMGHVIPAFIILGLGLLLATIPFIFELFHHYCQGKTVAKAKIMISEAWMPTTKDA